MAKKRDHSRLLFRIWQIVQGETRHAKVYLTTKKNLVYIISERRTRIIEIDIKAKPSVKAFVSKFDGDQILNKPKMQKITTTIIAAFFVFASKAQYVDPYHNWNFSYGRTGTPGDIIKIGLEYGSGERSSINAEAGMELSRTNNLRYKSFSLNASYRYYLVGNTLMTSKNKTNLAFGVGAVGQIDSEPIIYKNWSTSQRFNFGITTHVMAEYFFDPVVGFFIQTEQRLMSKELLGRYNYFVTGGLKIHFGNQY